MNLNFLSDEIAIINLNVDCEKIISSIENINKNEIKFRTENEMT